MGDGALVEFANLNEAVNCADELQPLLDRSKRPSDPEGEIRIRIGISLEDGIVDGFDLFGHGVNTAACMESLAEQGSICLSGNVRGHLKDNAPYRLVALGRCQVKNIPQPVDVFRIRCTQESLNTGAGILTIEQINRFCMTPDGVPIAYVTISAGPTVVSVSN